MEIWCKGTSIVFLQCLPLVLAFLLFCVGSISVVPVSLVLLYPIVLSCRTVFKIISVVAGGLFILGRGVRLCPLDFVVFVGDCCTAVSLCKK